MRNYVSDAVKIKTADSPNKSALPPDNDDEEEETGYPDEDGVVHMIFGRASARPTKHREKLIRRKIYNAEPATSLYLKWSETPITFDRTEHPDYMMQPGCYRLVVALLLGTK
jgi:hypothetical protein